MDSRPLLCSELAIVQAACDSVGVATPTMPSVLREEYAPSQKCGRPSFNTDFSLWLQHRLPVRSDRVVGVVPVRPHTVGAECFVTIQNNGTPSLVELIGGESLSIDSFSDVIARVDAISLEVLGQPCRNLEYVRLFELPKGISFLAAKSHVRESARFPAERKFVENGLLFIRSNGSEPVMMDGVLEAE